MNEPRTPPRGRKRLAQSDATYGANAIWDEAALEMFADFLLKRAAQRRISKLSEDQQRLAS
jgi:hypothetical protein